MYAVFMPSFVSNLLILTLVCKCIQAILQCFNVLLINKIHNQVQLNVMFCITETISAFKFYILLETAVKQCI